MVPAFRGEHFLVNCADCKFPFPVDATKVPNHGNATCPNCGFSENPYKGLTAQPPTPIQLDVSNNSFNRWDVVAFQFNATKTNGIKRIVGLPGESIEIRLGDIYVKGVLAARNWEIVDEMKILVFDSKYIAKSSADESPKRIETSGDWQSINQGYQLIPNPDQTFSRGQLNFQPINCFRGSENRAPTTFVQDNYGYNQSNSRSRLNDVDQLLVETEVNINAGGQIAISIASMSKLPARFVLNSNTRSVSIEVGDEILTQQAHNFLPGRHLFSAASIDGVYRAFLDGKLICRTSIPQHSKVPQPTATNPVSIFAKTPQGSPLELLRLKVYRDIVYTDRGNSKFQLGANEYLVFGDNSPVSVDGRTWSNPAINVKQIHGIVSPTVK